MGRESNKAPTNIIKRNPQTIFRIEELPIKSPHNPIAIPTAAAAPIYTIG